MRLRSVGFALAVGVIVTGCNAISGPASATVSSGPAAPTPYPGKTFPPSGFATATPEPAASEACTADQLHVAWLKAGGYQGNATETLELATTSGTACYLPGAPQLSVTFLASGAREAVDSGQFSSQRVDIQPGQAALLLFGSPASCAATPDVVSTVSVSIPGSGVIAVSGLDLDVACAPPTLLLFEVTDYPGAAAS